MSGGRAWQGNFPGLFVGGVLLLLGGELLVKGAVALAERRGVRPLTIGLTLVAFETWPLRADALAWRVGVQE